MIRESINTREDLERLLAGGECPVLVEGICRGLVYVGNPNNFDMAFAKYFLEIQDNTLIPASSSIILDQLRILKVSSETGRKVSIYGNLHQMKEGRYDVLNAEVIQLMSEDKSGS